MFQVLFSRNLTAFVSDMDVVFVDDTILEAPQTPAPVFAVRAFKQAIFGTPQTGLAEEKRTLGGKPKDKLPTTLADGDDEKPIAESNRLSSPTKPPGILLTPGTATARRKQVTFGAHVVDNERKKPTSRSGLPNDFPGKFPSPWTPKIVESTEKKEQPEAMSGTTDNEVKPEVPPRKNKSSQANEAADIKNTQPRKPRAKDDADLTTDFLDPRSESGRYWKEQYLLYSGKSEEEVKKLIAKAKLAKDYAKKKDDEALELRQQLDTERKKRHTREKALEKQIKDLRERLRLALAENGRTTAELALLRKRVEAHKHDLQRDSSKTAPETRPTTPEPDSGWSEAAGPESDTSYIPKSVRSSSTRASTRPQRARSARKPREKPENQPSGGRKRADSVVDRKREQSSTPVEFVKTALSPIKGSPSSPLKPHSPNIAVRSPPRVKAKFVPDKVAYRQSRGVCDAPTVDSSAPLEAFGMQADQPVTPSSAQKRVRRQRNAAISPGIPTERATAAAARVAARRKLKRLQKENK